MISLSIDSTFCCQKILKKNPVSSEKYQRIRLKLVVVSNWKFRCISGANEVKSKTPNTFLIFRPEYREYWRHRPSFTIQHNLIELSTWSKIFLGVHQLKSNDADVDYVQRLYNHYRNYDHRPSAASRIDRILSAHTHPLNNGRRRSNRRSHQQPSDSR